MRYIPYVQYNITSAYSQPNKTLTARLLLGISKTDINIQIYSLSHTHPHAAALQRGRETGLPSTGRKRMEEEGRKGKNRKRKTRSYNTEQKRKVETENKESECSEVLSAAQRDVWIGPQLVWDGVWLCVC